MPFNPRLPVTVTNCPTRDALEKEPKLHQKIVRRKKAANSAKKAAQRLENLATRREKHGSKK